MEERKEIGGCFIIMGASLFVSFGFVVFVVFSWLRDCPLGVDSLRLRNIYSFMFTHIQLLLILYSSIFKLKVITSKLKIDRIAS